uniref:Uncharacterized protein n=1 Tax=Arcella intermedia TaxID=1963864 RepID=A0A6B2LWC0_9EUKA
MLERSISMTEECPFSLAKCNGVYLSSCCASILALFFRRISTTEECPLILARCNGVA